MRYALIRRMDITNGDDIGISLFVQGCHFHCKGCFNPDTWNFKGGKVFTQDTITTLYDLSKYYYIKRLSILGGEPLADKNINDIYDFLKQYHASFPDKKIWLYTGYTFEEILDDSDKNKILQYIDILVDGRFIEELKDLTLMYRGSSNQRVIDVQSSLKQNKVISYI